MFASLVVGEIVIELEKEEILKIEKDSSLEGKIWIVATDEELPMRLYVADGPSWKATALFDNPENPLAEVVSYEVGFPPEGLKPLKEKKTIYSDFLQPGVYFRKIRIRRDDALF